MKRLILFLGLIISFFITSNAQYYRYEHYHICEPYVDRVYHVAPVHMKVRKSPRVIVVEEEENVIYYHKKKEPQVTHVYENKQSLNCNNFKDEVINIDDENTIKYSQMWKQTIWFNEDAYKINKDYNKVTLDNIANFMKEHPNVYIRVYGYASKRHGSYEYNKQLAANRCRMTKDYISNEYNINPSRIKLFVRGTDTPEYYVDKWNQCVIIKCDNKYE